MLLLKVKNHQHLILVLQQSNETMILSEMSLHQEW